MFNFLKRLLFVGISERFRYTNVGNIIVGTCYVKKSKSINGDYDRYYIFVNSKNDPTMEEGVLLEVDVESQKVTMVIIVEVSCDKI